jgi:LysM repeat protein
MNKISRIILSVTGIAALFVFSLFTANPVMAQSTVAFEQNGATCSTSVAKGYGLYVVRKGDTLQSISSSFGIPVSTITMLNPYASFTRNQVILLPGVEAPGLWDNELLCSPQAMYPGTNQQYANSGTVPVTGGSSSSSSSSTTTTTTTPATTTGTTCVNIPKPGKGYGVYIVRKGDSLASIAAKFGVSMSTITALNPGASYTRYSYLIIPGVEAPGAWDNQFACK